MSGAKYSGEVQMSGRSQGNSFALIGWGGIAKSVFDLAARNKANQLDCAGILVRPGREAATRADIGNIPVVTSLAGLLDLQPGLVVECAGHEALLSFGRAVLEAGIDVLSVSSGLLADSGIEAEMRRVTAAHGSRLVIASGALAGIDGLAAARHAGLDRVVYSGRKPAHAWRGTPAEKQVDLGTLSEETIIFEGSARDAARLYPKNANVAATIALAGIGFEKTEVRLIADPKSKTNVHELTYRGKFGEVETRINGLPSPENPKTSFLTALSVWRSILAMNSAGIVL